jgi:hypothetical protein
MLFECHTAIHTQAKMLFHFSRIKIHQAAAQKNFKEIMSFAPFFRGQSGLNQFPRSLFKTQKNQTFKTCVHSSSQKKKKNPVSYKNKNSSHTN